MIFLSWCVQARNSFVILCKTRGKRTGVEPKARSICNKHPSAWANLQVLRFVKHCLHFKGEDHKNISSNTLIIVSV